MTRLAFATLIGLVLLVAPLRAEEETAGDAAGGDILVTARRLPTERERSGVSISSMDAEALEDRQTTSVADAIREIPGAWVTRTGGVGGSTSVFLRGAASTQTKFRLDGIPLNDPTLGGQYNASDLFVVGLDRFEVLRGSQSTLYGSEAIGGVVQLVSRDYRGAPFLRLLGEGGSFATGRGEIEAGGGDDRFAGGLFGSFVTTDNAVRNNGVKGSTWGLRLHGRPITALELGLTARLVRSRAQDPYDFGDPIVEDENIWRERTTGALGGTLAWDAVDGVTVRAAGSYLYVDSIFENGPDQPGDPDELRSVNTARVAGGTLAATVEALRLAGVDAASARDRFTVGYEIESQHSISEVSSPWGTNRISRTVYDRAIFLQEELTIVERVDAVVGIRWTHNDFFGERTTPTVSLQYRHLETGTTIGGSYSLGYRAPAPIEFDDPFVGNPDLKEESSRSLDVGVRQELLGGNLRLGLTWFRLEVDDLIAYDPTTFRLENVNRTRTTGIELEGLWVIDENWSVGASYTHQDPKNLDASEGQSDRLPNRSPNFGSAWGRYRNGDLTVQLTGLFAEASPALGIEGPDQSARSRPGEKTLINLAASYRVDRARFFARIENLLDDVIVENERGPRSAGIGLTLGVEVGLGGELSPIR
jgi:vitamin B12 transporter